MPLPPPRPHHAAQGAVRALAVSLLLVPVAVLLDPNMPLWRLVALLAVGTLAGVTHPTLRALHGVAIAVAVLLGVTTLTPALRPVLAALDASSPPAKADAIVILGGGLNCGAGELEASSLDRLVRGLELWRAGFAGTITLTATPPDVFGESCPSLEAVTGPIVMRLYPTGGPQVVVLEDMRTTRTEALAVAREAKARGWRRVLVVTSPVHTRRALATFRNAGLDASAVASSEARFDSALRNPWDRFAALQPVTRELLGLLTYAWRGWL